MATIHRPSEPSLLPSRIFQKGVHDCPSCGSELSSTASACPRCHCQLELLGEALGKEIPPLDTIMDFKGLLQGDEAEIRTLIAHSERKFPQIRLMFCSIAVTEGLQANGVAWWMFNKGAHSTNPSWCGMLLVDPHSRQVTFQSGYALEVFVSRQKLEALLTECGDWFALGEWAGGTANFFKEFHAILKKAHLEALETRKFARKSGSKK